MAKARINVTAETKQATKSINKFANVAKSSFSSIGASIIVLNQGLNLLGKSFSIISSQFSSVINEFATFEENLIGVGKTTGLAGKELSALGKSFINLSEEIPVSSNALLELAGTAGQLGVTGKKNLENFSITIAKLGRASDLTGEQAATSLTRILNVTGESIDQIDELASVIVALGNNFAATESEIAGVANEVARATSAFNINSASVVGISTALKALGNRAEGAGSVIGKTFRTIDLAIRKGGASFEEIQKITGFTGDKLRDTFEKDSAEVFRVFVNGLGTIVKANGSVAIALEKIGLRGEGVNKVLPALAANSQILNKALALSSKELLENNALNEEAAKAFASLNSDIIRFKNTVQNLAIAIGKDLSPTFKSFLKSFANVIKGNKNNIVSIIERMIKSIPNVISSLKFFVKGLFLLAKSATITSAVFSNLVEETASFITTADGLKDVDSNFDPISQTINFILDQMIKLGARIKLIGVNFNILGEQIAKIGRLEFTKNSPDTANLIALRKQAEELRGVIKGVKDSALDNNILHLDVTAKDIEKFSKKAAKDIGKLNELEINILDLLKINSSSSDKLARDVSDSIQESLDNLKPVFITATIKNQGQGPTIENAAISQGPLASAQNGATVIANAAQQQASGGTNLDFEGNITRIKLEDDALDKMNKEINSGIDFADIALKIGKGFLEGSKLLIQTLGKGAEGAKDFLVSGATSVADALVPGAGAFVGPLVELAAMGKEKAKEQIQAFVSEIPIIIQAIVDALPVIFEEIAKAVPSILTSIVSNLDEIIIAVAKGSVQLTIALVKAQPEILLALGEAILSLAKTIGGVILGAIVVAMEQVGQFLSSAFDRIIAFIDHGFEDILQNFGNIFTDFITSLKDAFNFDGGGKGSSGRAADNIKGFFGFAKGGEIPGGFPNDTFPANLTSGELVVPNDTVGQLKGFLANNENTNQLLSRILDKVGGSNGSQSISLEINGEVLSNAILEANQNNERLTA